MNNFFLWAATVNGGVKTHDVFHYILLSKCQGLESMRL